MQTNSTAERIPGSLHPVVRLRSQCTTHHHACDCRERKLLAVLKPHMTELKLEGLRGNQIALQAFVDVDETWRELYGCSIEDDDRAEQPNDGTQRPGDAEATNATRATL
jgi:hypothetical protein